MSEFRDLTKEFVVPAGVASLSAIASLDPYFGVFDTASEAFEKVPVDKRKVGKLLATYTKQNGALNKTSAQLCMWTEDALGNWGIQRVGEIMELFQVITLGGISVDIPTMKVNIAVDRIGINQVRLNGILYSKSTPNEFTLDPIVTAGNFRKDIIEARPNSTLFFLKKGVESTNPVPPTVTSGAMLISEVLVTSAGASAGQESQLNNKLDKTTPNEQNVISPVVFNSTVSTQKLILQVQSSNTTVNAIWTDGTAYYGNGSGGTPKAFMYDESGTFTGSNIPLNLITGNFQVSAQNTSLVYTTSNLKRGGWAQILINASSEPSVTGAIKIAGSAFSASTNMYLNVRYNGNIVEFFFSRI